MKWSDEGILVALHNFGENAKRISVLTKNQGRHGGILKLPAKKAPVFQLGDKVHATWNARLQDHLGTYVLESLESPWTHFISSRLKLSILITLCWYVENLLAERHPYPRLYEGLVNLIAHLKWPHENCLKEYIDFELVLLKELGFGLDVSSCAVTGEKENLTHLSPKTGRAVCHKEALPYLSKLIPLPAYWLSGEKNPSLEELNQGLYATGYFIEKNLLNGGPLPGARLYIHKKTSPL